ncbi:MAG TPA: SUMF1/EgtB/PvdO family nonheme iron enzyme, partial [Bacteroidia bacterium]|nr:SUMF1/EgtB/PvdO family nonheme iron enzyme [Bacteroidia bacterium]
MKTQDNFRFNEQTLDAALGLLLLEQEQLFTEKNTETMATHIFSATELLPVSSSKEKELLGRLGGSSGYTRFFSLPGLAIAILLATACIYYFFPHQPGKPQPHTAAVSAAPGDSTGFRTTEKSPGKNVSAAVTVTVTPPAANSSPSPAVSQKDSVLAESESILPVTQDQLVYSHMPEDLYIGDDDIPVLTDAQKKKCAKEKLGMMKDVFRRKFPSYQPLPGGTTSVNGKQRKVNGFYIASAEVTNLEYRTFLYDLLIQGREDDYVTARPVKGGWSALGIPEFEDIYWKSETYNDFPAVNITRKGAEMYCEWFTTSMKEAIANKDLKWKTGNPEFRLPSNVEWIYAARGGDSTELKFPWGKFIPDSAQNHHGCFLCNFNYTASKDVFIDAHICPGFSKLKQGGFHHAILTTAGMAIDTLVTAPVYSY